MEGDFRRPPRRPDGFAGGRPQPQASHRQAPVTDLRPQAQQTPPTHQPTARPTPAAPVPPPAAKLPRPTTAELIARHEHATKPRSNTKRNLVLAVVGLVIIVAGALLFAHHTPAKSSGPFPASITSTQITIPVYFPKNLPTGFKVSSYKLVKQDVLNYVVTNANNDSFYVNIQPVPAGYDFSAFNKRFASPTTYTTSIGTATQGLMNNQLICSVVAAKSWVMINTTAIKDTADMAVIAKALKPATI